MEQSDNVENVTSFCPELPVLGKLSTFQCSMFIVGVFLLMLPVLVLAIVFLVTILTRHRLAVHCKTKEDKKPSNGTRSSPEPSPDNAQDSREHLIGAPTPQNELENNAIILRNRQNFQTNGNYIVEFEPADTSEMYLNGNRSQFAAHKVHWQSVSPIPEEDRIERSPSDQSDSARQTRSSQGWVHTDSRSQALENEQFSSHPTAASFQCAPDSFANILYTQVSTVPSEVSTPTHPTESMQYNNSQQFLERSQLVFERPSVNPSPLHPSPFVALRKDGQLPGGSGSGILSETQSAVFYENACARTNSTLARTSLAHQLGQLGNAQRLEDVQSAGSQTLTKQVTQWSTRKLPSPGSPTSPTSPVSPFPAGSPNRRGLARPRCTNRMLSAAYNPFNPYSPTNRTLPSYSNFTFLPRRKLPPYGYPDRPDEFSFDLAEGSDLNLQMRNWPAQASLPNRQFSNEQWSSLQRLPAGPGFFGSNANTSHLGNSTPTSQNTNDFMFAQATGSSATLPALVKTPLGEYRVPPPGLPGQGSNGYRATEVLGPRGPEHIRAPMARFSKHYRTSSGAAPSAPSALSENHNNHDTFTSVVPVQRSHQGADLNHNSTASMHPLQTATSSPSLLIHTPRAGRSVSPYVGQNSRTASHSDPSASTTQAFSLSGTVTAV